MKSVQKSAMALIIAVQNSRSAYAVYLPSLIALALLAEAQKLNGVFSTCRSSQLSRKVFHVYARPPINMRREFFGQYSDIHGDTPQMKWADIPNEIRDGIKETPFCPYPGRSEPFDILFVLEGRGRSRE